MTIAEYIIKRGGTITLLLIMILVTVEAIAFSQMPSEAKEEFIKSPYIRMVHHHIVAIIGILLALEFLKVVDRILNKEKEPVKPIPDFRGLVIMIIEAKSKTKQKQVFNCFISYNRIEKDSYEMDRAKEILKRYSNYE